MSKLDDIQFFYKGEAITLRHKPQAKQQIKDLMLEIIDYASENDEDPDIWTYDDQGERIVYVDKLYRKVSEL